MVPIMIVMIVIIPSRTLGRLADKSMMEDVC